MRILDATAGRREFWFDKHCDEAIFVDVRREVKPDICADSKSLPFRSAVFDIIVFDPPYKNYSGSTSLADKYGHFRATEIRNLIKEGAREFNRCLTDEGILLFKWSTINVKLENILYLMIGYFKPLFGQRTAYRVARVSKTYWVCLRRIPYNQAMMRSILHLEVEGF